MSRFRLSLAVVALGAVALAGCETLPLSKPPPAVTLANPCADLTVSIYFQRDSTKLTREARAALRSAAAQTSSCTVSSVDVYGLSDAVGEAETNLVISKARADEVTAELSRLGFNAVNFKVVAAGEAGALTESGEARPLRRRADVIFHLTQAS